MAGAALAIALPAIVSAQTGQTAQIPLQFDFLNPGARSLGLGGAFVAVADDATAALTNPAGLTQTIRKYEFTAELRYRTLDTPYLSVGRLSGAPTGQGLDTVRGPVYGLSTDAAVRPYFLSAAYKRGKFFAAAYRHELVLQTNSFISQGPFYAAGGAINARLFGLAGDRDIHLIGYGVSAAYSVSPRVSIGEGISFYRLSLDSHFAALDSQGPYGPADLTTAGHISTTTQNGSGLQGAFNVGALVTLTPILRVGAVFRQSATFHFTEITNVPDGSGLTRVGTFRTPAVFGAAVRVDASDAWTFAIDYDRVQYANLTTDFITFQVDPSQANRIAIRSGNELHVGVEYSLLRVKRKPSIRAGIWFDPDHAVQYASDRSGSDADTRLKAVFPGGSNAWHYCLGFGMPLSRRLEINAGSDFASQRKYASASAVVRFDKLRK
jgi:long-chain fatty acid transport protein